MNTEKHLLSIDHGERRVAPWPRTRVSLKDFAGGAVTRGFAEAEENHRRDASRVRHAERWRWLRDAMDFGFRSALARARQGLITSEPHGEVLWSAVHERTYSREHRLPSKAELDVLFGRNVGT